MKLKLGRCRINVSYYFFVLLAFAGICGEKLMAGMIAAAIHEYGHILAACLCTGECMPVYFDITPFGLKMGVIPISLSRKKELIILAGGAAANVAASVLLSAAAVIFPESRDIIFSHIAAEICIAAVNMAAVQPLDGGKILYTLLTVRMDVVKAERATFAISLVTLFFMTLTGALVLMHSRKNISLLVLALWLLMRCLRGEWE